MSEPAPRTYPPGITLIERSRSGRSSVPDGIGLDDVEDWLVSEAIGQTRFLHLFEAFVWRLVAAGLPLDRATLHIGTLHPQIYGFGWNWHRADGTCDEVKIAQGTTRSDAYRRNPLFRVIEYGETVHVRPTEEAVRSRFPLLAELAADGYTDYVAVPLGGASGFHNAGTVATRRPDGFTDPECAALVRLMRFFALHVERHIISRIAGNVLDTYLGHAAGAKVLDGSITRGAGEAIRAVIWVSDMRGFSRLSDRLAGPDVTLVLNAYFERLVDAVMRQGGEVLKFIGDGLLAVFPFTDDAEAADAARRAVKAAQQACADMDRLNEAPPAELAAIDGWNPLRTGIALHEGDVFFGNVGAPERLDFTVIGRAVNEASRVEGLCKALGRTVLITRPVAERLETPLESLGQHDLKGVSRPMAVYGLAGDGRD